MMLGIILPQSVWRLLCFDLRLLVGFVFVGFMFVGFTFDAHSVLIFDAIRSVFVGFTVVSVSPA